jgi:hypothetical protein
LRDGILVFGVFLNRLYFSVHAAKRMVERRISPDTIRLILETGTVIADYPDDKPFPSRLILGWEGLRPIHIVAATDGVSEMEYIITVYEPESDKWDNGFSIRRKS